MLKDTPHRAALRLAVSGALLAATGACATNPLRLEYASTVAADGAEAAAASRAFLDHVDQAREDATIELAVLDPACGTTRPRLRAQPLIGRRAPARGFYCRLATEPRNNDDVELRVAPLRPQLEPTLHMIEAMVAYSDALGQIAAEKAGDPIKPINDALETAQAVSGALNAIAPSARLSVPGSDDKTVQALEGFIRFVGELAHEADQVRALREVVSHHPEGIHPLVVPLRGSLESWEISRSVDRGWTIALADTLARNMLDTVPPGTPEARRAALTRSFELRRAERQESALAPAVYLLLDALDKSDADFRRVLSPHPDLTPVERRKVAEIARQRVVRALNIFTSIVTAIAKA